MSASSGVGSRYKVVPSLAFFFLFFFKTAPTVTTRRYPVSIRPPVPLFEMPFHLSLVSCFFVAFFSFSDLTGSVFFTLQNSN